MAEQSIREVSADLGLSSVDDLQRLDVSMRAEISALQLHVNNPSKAYAGSFSVAESPVRVFVDCMRRDGVLPAGVVFCCIDEYENLLDYQQAILNTYIKHAEDPLTYKIGLRKFGLRNRRTIDEGDLLACPDDYDEIEIADNGFSEFAKAVAEARLRRANEEGVSVSRSLREFLSELTFAEEARLLGAPEVASIVRKEIEGSSSLELSSFVGSLPDESAYFIKFWAESEGGSIEVLAADWMRNPQSWATRLGNYGYASLFWLSNGRKGARIRKYYSGEKVLLAMAGGNIRYFLELIDLAISYEQPTASTGGLYSVSAKAQTLAAREVGKRRLSQLDGLAENGPQLKRAVLGLGKVFFELARNPLGRTPEATSFVLAGDAVSCERVRDLLFEGVAHLAFEVDARTKATSTSEVKDEEFRIHRIFSAFFEMSHRKKRRITVSASDVLALLDEKPSKAISAMLGSANINEDDSLPEQLEFFARFYKDGQVQG
ncbi:hypothetical protein I5U36_01600 [Stenotrophomonas maltophilia]|nr:hypothetical protein [Stenotrophomonas maltophilia]MBH1436170.1 hypothetical protein [Stenotrophomonas maltophilia]